MGPVFSRLSLDLLWKDCPRWVPSNKTMKNIKHSLAFKIGLAYVVLTLINLIFFSVMIIENQTDLIITNFKHQSDNLARDAVGLLSNLKIGRDPNKPDYKGLHRRLQTYDLNWYKVFDAKGTIWHDYPATKQENQKKKVGKKVLQKIEQLNSRASLFQARYLVELQKEDFSINLLLPLGKKNSVFLFTSLNLKSMQSRLYLVYYQVLGAIVWGIAFHFLFALFLIRVIFRRVAALLNASSKMSRGDLSSRVDWKIDEEKKDELDTLGLSFNEMASNVQEKVRTISEQIETISTLNRQIQQELKIGKEVQRLLISTPESVMKDYKTYVYYRPLREVSGDMFHYFKFTNEMRGLFFADASGHGVPAALVTAISFLGLEDVLRQGLEKEDLMNTLNHSITVRMQQAFYLTAVLVLFDDRGRLWLSNAGHNAFFILPREGKRIEIEADGLPIGVLPDSEYPLHQYQAQKGDRIFVYSDGLVETTNKQKEEFSLERLTSILDKHRSHPIEEMCKEVQQSFEDFAHNFTDDVTFLCMEIP